MYFGRSIFQSVVERLQSESSEAGEANLDPSLPRSPRIAQDFLVDSDLVETNTEASASISVNFYQDFELDESAEVANLLADPAATITPAPIEEPLPAAPHVDFHYLSATSPEAVKAELALETITSIELLQGKRRQFARHNHPDRVPQEWRDQATCRMTAANQLIDMAIKNINLLKRLGA